MKSSESLEYREAERKSIIMEIQDKASEAWCNEMITDKAYNKIMNICAKELYWKNKTEKKEAEPAD